MSVPFKLVYKFNAFPIKNPNSCACIYRTLKTDPKNYMEEQTLKFLEELREAGLAYFCVPQWLAKMVSHQLYENFKTEYNLRRKKCLEGKKHNKGSKNLEGQDCGKKGSRRYGI